MSESTHPVSPAKRPVIELRRVVKTYYMGEVEVNALRGLSLVVERGDFVAVMGASGSGKSTLMNIIGCLDVPSRGSFWLDGVDVRTLDEESLAIVRNRKIGFVFQSYNLIPRTTAIRERRAASRVWRREGARSPGARRCPRWSPSGYRTASSTCRARCPAVSSSGSPSPGRS